MKNPSCISHYCHIKAGSVSLNGKKLFERTSPDLSGFLKAAYQHFETDYPKFFKMDRLSKLAFMAVEVLLEAANASEKNRTTFQEMQKTSHTNQKPSQTPQKISQENRDMAIVLSNRASSLDTDRKYQESISDLDNFYPSPAVFVYTLPNICIGEISIRHRLRSENSFFIFEAFNPGFLKDYADSLLQHEKADEVLCGWVDVDEDAYEAFLYIVSRTGSYPHTEQQLTELYLTP